VRAKADENAKVLSTASKGDKLTCKKNATAVDGWVAVTVKKKTGYVPAGQVKLKLGTTKAVAVKKTATTKSVSSSSSGASSDDVTLLAALIQCEAGGESYTGKVAVGAVVLNRVRSSQFAGSISGVIYQSGQFTPVRNGALARRLSSSISSSCRQAALDALAGSDPTGGSLFFHRVDGCRGLVIGNHVFY
jgi:spore germination cell wall hydrolase CwlJ-like protein